MNNNWLRTAFKSILSVVCKNNDNLLDYYKNAYSVEKNKVLADQKVIQTFKKQLEELTKQYNNLKLSEQAWKNKAYELEHKNDYRSKIKNYLNQNYHRVLLFYRKRWVLSLKNVEEPMLFSDFVQKSTTLRNHFMGSSVEQVWNHNIEYVRDNYTYKGCLDVWQLPLETYILGKGDCDDSTAFRVATAKSIGLEDELRGVFFMAVGEYVRGDSVGGHAFPVFIDEKLNWFVLEATNNIYTKRKYPNEHYRIEFMTDGEDTWAVNGGNTFGGTILKEFDLEKPKKV